ncbi:hypothetical protein L9F63_004291, partial [Diploptera punctata]
PDIPGFLLQPFRKPKRIRTAFSPSQLLKLEHAFEKNHYVVGAERKQLAQSLSLTETQVLLRDHVSRAFQELYLNNRLFSKSVSIKIIKIINELQEEDAFEQEERRFRTGSCFSCKIPG